MISCCLLCFNSLASLPTPRHSSHKLRVGKFCFIKRQIFKQQYSLHSAHVLLTEHRSRCLDVWSRLSLSLYDNYVCCFYSLIITYSATRLWCTFIGFFRACVLWCSKPSSPTNVHLTEILDAACFFDQLVCLALDRQRQNRSGRLALQLVAHTRHSA
jgi:hypothetical protein